MPIMPRQIIRTERRGQAAKASMNCRRDWKLIGPPPRRMPTASIVRPARLRKTAGSTGAPKAEAESSVTPSSAVLTGFTAICVHW